MEEVTVATWAFEQHPHAYLDFDDMTYDRGWFVYVTYGDIGTVYNRGDKNGKFYHSKEKAKEIRKSNLESNSPQ